MKVKLSPDGCYPVPKNGSKPGCAPVVTTRTSAVCDLPPLTRPCLTLRPLRECRLEFSRKQDRKPNRGHVPVSTTRVFFFKNGVERELASVRNFNARCMQQPERAPKRHVQHDAPGLGARCLPVTERSSAGLSGLKSPRTRPRLPFRPVSHCPLLACPPARSFSLFLKRHAFLS